MARLHYRQCTDRTAGGRREKFIRSLLLFLFVASWFAPFPLHAQGSDSGLSFRIIPGFEWGLSGTIERSPGALNTAELQSPGTGRVQGLAGSLFLEWGARDVRSGEFGLVGRVGMTFREGDFTSNPYSRVGPGVDMQTGDTVKATYRFRVATGEKRLEGAVLGLWGITRNLSAFGGGWVGYRFATTIDQTESILSPLNVVFSGSATPYTRDLAEGESVAAYPLRFGGMVGGRLRVGEVYGVGIEPEAFLRFDAESLFKDKIGFNALSGGFGIAFSLGNKRASDMTLSDTALRSLPRFALTSSVRLYQVGLSDERDSAIRLRPQRTLHHRYQPVVPILSAAQILSSPFVLPDSSAADSFSMEVLYNVPSDQLSGYTLNVVAGRMRDLPETTLQISGNRSGEVAAYLMKIWKIGGDRLSISTRGDEGPDKIELLSSNSSLFTPMFQQWVVDEFAPVRIGLAKTIRAEAGLHHWELSVRQGERELARYQSDSAENREPTLTLEDLAAADGILPLQAELIVEDYRGVRDTSRTSLTLVRDGREPIEIESYEYRLFDPAPAPSVAVADRALLEHLAETARNGVAIEMTSDLPTLRSSSSYADSASILSVEEIAGDLLSKLRRRGVEVESLKIERGERDTSTSGQPGGIRILARQVVE